MGLRAALRVLSSPETVRRERKGLLSRLREVDARVAALGAEDRALLEREALRLAGLRQRIGELTGAPECCRSCALRMPGGVPEFPGGFCCGGGTEGVTPWRELAAIRLAGADLAETPVTMDHAGCIFRTREGCTLTPRDRPSMCVRYACRELARELHGRGVMGEIALLSGELEAGVAAIEAKLGLAPPSP
jgi:hypothetical protein